MGNLFQKWRLQSTLVFTVVNIALLCRHLGSQLAELERVIERMMEADFVEFATANLGRTAEDDMGNEDLVDEVFSKKKKPSDGLSLYLNYIKTAL